MANPYLPLNTYIPDAEPHVFGDRLYIFGSHDKENGETYCMLDYEVWSSPVENPGCFTCHGTVYRAAQDPLYGEGYKQMYAPDVVRGTDGRYYLYYAMAGEGHFTSTIRVAVCDVPGGQYSFYGEVRNPDGSPFRRKVTFDPGVLNDDGTIRLYFGWALAVDNERLKTIPDAATIDMISGMIFGKSPEEIAADNGRTMGAFTVELDDDMLTVRTEPKEIIPGQFYCAGTEFDKGNAFFEASSMRKINGKYYFIYSSEQSHDLSYAVSDEPDGGFRYGGVIISNGDIGLSGRTAEQRLNTTGNNHGSLECVNGQWYVFWHRQTNKCSFSRQGCVEPVTILPDGSIPQVPVSSMGFQTEGLSPAGEIPAVVCCGLSNGHMLHNDIKRREEPFPFLAAGNGERYIAALEDGTQILYRDFLFDGPVLLRLEYRSEFPCSFEITAGETAAVLAEGDASDSWTTAEAVLTAEGKLPLTIVYRGGGNADLKTLCFVKQ